MKAMDNPEFFILPANNQDTGSIKNIVFTVLTEYELKPDEGRKDMGLNDLKSHYF